MKLRTKLILPALSLAVAAAVLPSQAAVAQATMNVGAKVSDTAGGEVGTITKVDGQYVILKTDKHEVRLPSSSFTAVDSGYIMAMTRDEVNAAVEKTLAEANAKIVAGASVTGSEGSQVGTIETLEDQYVTLKLNSGALVKLPRSGIAAGANGAVIGMTGAELEAAAQAALGASQ